MRLVFVDTSHLVAIINPDDALHRTALAMAAELYDRADVRFVTSSAVIGELLTFVSRKHATIKLEALAFAERMIADAISQIDCMSMVICEQRSITEVLTADRDFEQEGLRALLREQA